MLQFVDASHSQMSGTQTHSYQTYTNKDFSSNQQQQNLNGDGAMITDPTSQAYLDWYRGLNNKLQGTRGGP